MKRCTLARTVGFAGAFCLLAFAGAALDTAAGVTSDTAKVDTAKPAPITRDWKKELTSEQYHILREKGTERAFTGKYDNEHAKGTYHCAGCGESLFESSTKFDSGTGWPSFYQPIAGHVKAQVDSGHGMSRTEVVCANCGGHLGHVFNDGPKPTGKRYCTNSPALKLVKAQ